MWDDWIVVPKKIKKSKILPVKKSAAALKPVVSQLVFFKIDVGCVETLNFLEEMFLFLGFHTSYKDDHQVHLKNGDTSIVVYHRFNVSGSGIYVLDTGVNAMFFKVGSRSEVDRFAKEFLVVRQISSTTNDPKRPEEGGYSVFFKTPELMTIGVVSD